MTRSIRAFIGYAFHRTEGEPMKRWTFRDLTSKHGPEIMKWRAAGLSHAQIAREITERTGVKTNRWTIRRTLDEMDREKMIEPPPLEPFDDSPVIREDLEEKIEDLIARRLQDSRRAVGRIQSRTRVCRMSSAPFGLWLVGDVHIDDPGCRFDLLHDQVQAVAAVEGVLGVSVGDHQNHWIGARLSKLYSKQPTTASEGWKLVEWLLCDSGVDWLAVISGNHDHWATGAGGVDHYFKITRSPSVRYYDEHELRIRFVFEDGDDPMTFVVRHDFRGRSQYSPVHGGTRATLWDPDIDLAVAGHTHEWGEHRRELPGVRDRCPMSIRVRGYKHDDAFAREKGFHSGRFGQSCLVIIDPTSSGPGRMTVAWDLDRGLAILEAMRSEYRDRDTDRI